MTTLHDPLAFEWNVKLKLKHLFETFIQFSYEVILKFPKKNFKEELKEHCLVSENGSYAGFR